MDFIDLLRSYPVIPALRFEGQKKIDLSSIQIGGPCFLLDGNINTIKLILEKIEKHFSTFFLHLDLFSGLSADQDGLIFLKKHFQEINGIISTRSRTISLAKKQGFITIFRIFLLDSESLNTGLKVASQLSPDAIEILPGIIFPFIQKQIPIKSLPPIICGGFIRNHKEVKAILRSGATAISTSSPDLWTIE
ncbi:MAG TPA: glycerol-3-phosphate responsive antiterminator [Candidatus Atribacteria bacterium]|nr:glycerol-3-phosphate responsive antiterminator [Candidatus Atribacteria bacterium]HCU23033.1 glycerol-3-phosphate responsive antiterminator [Candidatus Atribacteria bacterium]